MKRLESQLQQQCILWHRRHLPEVLVFAIPNGGYRLTSEAVRLKSEGVLPGVPDLCIPYPITTASGLYLELKTKKGRISAVQNDMLSRLEDLGYCCGVVRSLQQYQNEVMRYLTNAKAKHNTISISRERLALLSDCWSHKKRS